MGMAQQKIEPGIKELQDSVHELHETVRGFPERFPWVFDPLHMFLYALLRGIAYSIGLILAVALVVPLVISTLRGVDWVPLVGDFLKDVAVRIE